MTFEKPGGGFRSRRSAKDYGPSASCIKKQRHVPVTILGLSQEGDIGRRKPYRDLRGKVGGNDAQW